MFKMDRHALRRYFERHFWFNIFFAILTILVISADIAASSGIRCIHAAMYMILVLAAVSNSDLTVVGRSLLDIMEGKEWEIDD